MRSTEDAGTGTAPQTRHVVFIGETGAGKSSVINLLVDRERAAATSPDAAPCTREFAPYDVSVEGRMYRLWDTPGLNEASRLGLFRRLTRVDSLKQFLRDKHRLRELDLLVFCVQGGRAHKSMSKAYKIFGRATRQMAIPVVIAVTHLEEKQPTMDAWWQDNERALRNLGLEFDGYACLTCLPSNHRAWASQVAIRVLISTEYQRSRAQPASSGQEYLNDSNSVGCMVC